MIGSGSEYAVLAVPEILELVRQSAKIMHVAVTASQLAAGASVVTAVMAVVTGTVAIFTLRSLKADSRSRTRPVVVAELARVLLTKGSLELIVRNVGPTVARRVRVEFDPPIQASWGVLAASLAHRYADEIPTLGPGRELKNLYAQFEYEAGTGGKLREPAPNEVVVKITYWGSDDKGPPFTDSYRLALDKTRGDSETEPSNMDFAGRQRRLLRALETIARGVGR